MNRVKPLLFLLEKESGTMGDQKPFSILSVIAASVSHLPVTLYCNGFEDAPEFMGAIKRFAKFLMGPNALDHFHIEYGSKHPSEKFWTRMNQTYCVIDNFDFDFGASVERAKNRFTTKLFPYRAKLLDNGEDWTMVPTNKFFGPVFLPISEEAPFWSKLKIVDKLIQFRETHKNRKIIAIAGSLRPVFSLDEISQWLNNNLTESLWAFIIIDVYNSGDFNDHRVLVLEYVEFEDLVRFSNVFIGNCGAGSTMTAMSEALVQTCRISGSVGADKPFNQQVISHLGPSEPRFHQVMEMLSRNFTQYEVNALKFKFIIHHEVKQMIRNMYEFFGNLSSDVSLQKEYTQTRLIPVVYALE
jgi:hypothetical protein